MLEMLDQCMTACRLIEHSCHFAAFACQVMARGDRSNPSRNIRTDIMAHQCLDRLSCHYHWMTMQWRPCSLHKAWHLVVRHLTKGPRASQAMCNAGRRATRLAWAARLRASNSPGRRTEAARPARAFWALAKLALYANYKG